MGLSAKYCKRNPKKPLVIGTSNYFKKRNDWVQVVEVLAIADKNEIEIALKTKFNKMDKMDHKTGWWCGNWWRSI